MKRSISMLGLVAAFAVGCASTPVPAARVASAESAVQTARDAGAERVPDANAQLQRAEAELGKAKSLSQEGKTDEAEALLTRAQSDAALAAALAREGNVKARIDNAEKQPAPAPTQGPSR